ncbi:hypothetical protein GGR50DRAFT_45070 [Xylaria sp. CBS 124048]|nr:hypothetical protein GGR50DRAFT_45070 [Xylaria sp. CBS 124048]
MDPSHPDVEILIHIEAPSKAADDARYRSLAAAYLDFEPAEPAEPAHTLSQDRHDSSSHGCRRGPDVQASQLLEADGDEASVIPSGMGLGSLSFRSVVDNAGSPRMRMGEAPGHDNALVDRTPVSSRQVSWETPPSIVQDSHPMNHTDFTSLTTPTRVLENYLQHFDSPSSSIHRSPSSQQARAEEADQNAGQDSPAENLVPCTPQMIPRSTNTTGLISRESGGAQQGGNNPQQQLGATAEKSDDNIIEETILVSSSQLSAPGRADSEPPPKLRRLENISNLHALVRTLSDTGSRSSPHPKAPVTVTFISSHGFTYESLEILPPEPPTSDRHLEPHTLITPGLQKLGDDVNISSRFRPKKQVRPLEPYERGYWRLDCSTWEPRLKRDAWAFLANYIGTGIAGWGIRCKRDPDFRELRAYCFGLAAAHIYYVLWLSSQRKIVFTGSSWIDGGGAEVIVMGSRANPRG